MVYNVIQLIGTAIIVVSILFSFRKKKQNEDKIVKWTIVLCFIGAMISLGSTIAQFYFTK
ncbi:hypothetical protein E4665_03805 [Sporolactobacillus shoreae]|uniref:Uncharacterized protein n=1 Tax=Sporolactobacillus shoreae TaxID=1465501 RepID=A0A4Z0GS56_9BACL|nr:hypothetical protein [Sporolactobacillus shoreae]TGA99458.1 hypothetical protein E4665_03805 [Sporolactobacillus shoreae]